ncbi:blue (type 1) copper domain protein [Natrialba hulunbeirensis JCM 10989]|uniref:Blue (Type 1) copper domain protein n=1 Tax=Natrialba hulunbeirensis JCM 10989 TaxID=1227493 RepID=L9ZZW8_9EURY|nr:blue (type 1) copper domain protein [Natrialba hulunbeirensis JCM 10989]
MIRESTRRRILQLTGGTLAIGFLGTTVSAQDDDPIEAETEIMFDGLTEGWVGVEPEEIEDEENPTLILTEGDAYEITFENMDGAEHNLEIVDEDDEVVGEYETDTNSEEGETETLEIDEVTDEMAEYVCRPHQETMRGEIDVQ